MSMLYTKLVSCCIDVRTLQEAAVLILTKVAYDCGELRRLLHNGIFKDHIQELLLILRLSSNMKRPTLLPY